VPPTASIALWSYSVSGNCSNFASFKQLQHILVNAIHASIVYPAASLSSSLSQILHACTVFLAFREIYILEVPHFGLISKIKML